MIARILALVGIAVIAQALPQTPKFTAGVDVVELDVTVLDKNHKPVRGLKAEDFTIREDKVAQKIVAFDEVYSEPPKPPSAPWIRDVPPDVESNVPAEHNLFVIVIDDALLPYVSGTANLDPFRLQRTKEVARRVVQGMADEDLAAVVFSWDNWKGVNFTSDRARLLKAVDATSFGPTPVRNPQITAARRVLLPVVQALANVRHRKKTVFYVTNGLSEVVPDPYVRQAMELAQRSNVNIYSFDPSGLRANLTKFDRDQIEFLQMIAENTGGRPTVNVNRPEDHVADVLEEARAYYLIGYELSGRGADSRFHLIDVKVNRPDVEAHTRSTRFEPKPEIQPGKTPPPLEDAVGGFLPKSDVRLTLTTAAFANADGTARVKIAVEGQLPDPVSGQSRDSMHLAMRVFTTDGRAVTGTDRNVPVLLEAVESNSSSSPLKGPRFSLSSDAVLKPGTYALRVGVESAAAGKTGSVYSDIVVPDFAKLPLSLSGILMTASTGGSLRGNALDVLESTASRTFATDDRMQAFLRVYQGGQAAPSAVTMRVRIVDEHNADVVDRSESVPAAAFARDRQADYSVRLPLSALKPGEYWLAIEAKTGKQSATRDVRFRVK